MAIFRETEDFIGRIEQIRRRLEHTVDVFSRTIDTIWDLVDRTRGLLLTGEMALKALSSALDRSANAIGRIPAPGFWRIIPVGARGILEAVAETIEALAEGIERIRKALRGRRLRRIESVIDRIDDLVISFSRASASARAIFNLLERICQILETQQDAIEEAFPGLAPEIRRLLSEWEDTLQAVEDVVDQVESGTEAVEARVEEIQRILDLLRDVESLQRVVEGQIGSIVDVLSSAMESVKEFIDSIPGVGWVLGKLDELVEWAMEELGINAAFALLGEQIKNLPFFQQIQEFIDSIEEAFGEIEQQIRRLEQMLEEAEEKAREMEERAKAIIERFIGVGIDKDLIELLIPDWLRDARERLEGLRERLQEGADDNPEETESQLRESRKSINKAIDSAELGPRSEFGKAALAELAESFVSLKKLTEHMKSAETAKQALKAIKPLEAAESVLAPYAEIAASLPEGYFNTLRELLGRTEEGADYVAKIEEALAEV